MQSNPSLAVVRQLLYNHNPFYVISAVLVLCGVWRAVAGQEALAAGWPMWTLLCVYILLLAGAAWAIVRWGGVWQDVRTLLVVMVLMLVALSMSFDAVSVLDLNAGRQMLLAGLAFAIVVSEANFRVLGMRLSWFYRGPYYAILTLLFAYPIWLAELVRREEDMLRHFSLMLFPTLSAAVLLTLLSAARLGRSRKWATGTPWTWPLFPWTMFFFLALGLGARGAGLAFAFESDLEGASGFRAFWLSPLVLAVAWLLLEMGRSAGNRAAQTIAVLAPLAFVPLALGGIGDNPLQVRYLTLLQTAATSPAVLTAGMLLAFYAWAWLRKVRLAEAGLMAALALTAAVDSTTLDWHSLALRNPAALGAMLIIQSVLCARNRASWRFSLAAAIAIGALCWPVRDVTLISSGFAPLHAWILANLATGLLFDDRLARGIRRAVPFAIPALGLLAWVAYPSFFPTAPLAWQACYAGLLALLAVLFWRRVRELSHLAGAIVAGGTLAGILLHAGYNRLDGTPLAAGRDWLALGLASLGIGILISLAKGGVLRRIRLTLLAWNRRFQLPRPVD